MKVNKKHNDLTYIGIIAAVHLLCVILINPIGEFPLNDDWSHSYSVKHFLDTGRINILDWSPMSLIFQIWYGAIFSKIFGFSYTILRVSTLLLSLSGGIITYFILKEVEVKDDLCFLGSMLLSLNPIYLNLSYTFMTDIPFLTFSALSLLLYIRGYKYSRHKEFLTGSVVASVAALIRQPGILIPMAVFIFLFLKKKITLKDTARILFIPLLSFSIYLYWFIIINGSTETFASSSSSIMRMQNIPYKLFFRPFILFAYMGLFLSPLIIANIRRITHILKLHKNWVYIFAGILVLESTVSIFLATNIIPTSNSAAFSTTMPYSKNIISKEGLGPVRISGQKHPILPYGGWILLTAVSSLCAMALFAILVHRLKNNISHSNNILYIYGLGQILFFIFTEGTFDRYLLPIIIPAIVLTLNVFENKKASRTLLMVCITVSGIFSVVFTKEYLDWNRARWAACNQLLNAGITPEKIDGGFEFNNHYNYKTFNSFNTEYKIGFSAEKDHTIVYREKYASLYGMRYVYALKKD